MSDERLERKVRAALLADDPGPVPEELRLALARVPDQVPQPLVRARRIARLRMAAEVVAGVALAAVAIAIVIVLRGVGGGPIPSTLPGIVPWVDRPVASGAEPSPSQPPPADAPPCQPADLRVAVGPIGAAAGNINLPVTFVNDSGSACALIGYPSLVGITGAGAQESISVSHGSYFEDPGPPANLAPGGVGFAVVNISGADACPAAQSGSHKFYKVLRIGLPAGGSVDIAGSTFDTICGVSVSAFGVPAAASPPLAVPPLPLGAVISAPASVAPGTTLSYVVTITNATDTDFALVPCPAYEQFVGSGLGTTLGTTWIATILDGYLNCDTVRAIPAHGAVSYEMRLAIPGNQPAGAAKFGWDLLGGRGPWANASLQVQPTPGPTPSSGTDAAWFGQVSGWTLVDAPSPAQTFEAAANSWVAGLGFVTIQAAADARRQPLAPLVTIIAFTLTPEVGHTETELFSAMLQGLEGSLHVPAGTLDLGGPGFSFVTGEQKTIVGPWAAAPHSVYLSVVGPSIGDADTLYYQLLARSPPKTLP